MATRLAKSPEFLILGLSLRVFNKPDGLQAVISVRFSMFSNYISGSRPNARDLSRKRNDPTGRFDEGGNRIAG